MPRTSHADGAGAVWDDAHRALTIGLVLTISITAFEALAVATVLPTVAAELGRGDLGWYASVFSGFMLANLVGIPAAGVLSDRHGAARSFVTGSATFALGLVVSGLAQSMPWLVAGRVVQGFGAGALSSVAYAAVARGYAASSQPRMLALLASAWVVPGLVGPVAAAALAAALGWRWVFLALVPLTIGAAALAVSGLRGTASPARDADSLRPQSIRPALALAGGGALLMLAQQLPSLAVALACAAAGMALAAPAVHAMFPAGTLRAKPGAPAALAAKTLVTIAFFGAEAFLPLALTTLHGESIAMAGLALTSGTLSWTAGAWVQERLAARVSRARLLAVGLGLVAAAVAALGAALALPHAFAVAVLAWGAAGLGIGVAYSTTTLAVFELTPKGDEGSAGAALQLANVLGTAVGTGLGGAVLAAAQAAGCTAAHGLMLVNVAMFVAVVAALVAATRIPASTRPLAA